MWSFDDCDQPIALVTSCGPDGCAGGACVCGCEGKACGMDDGCGNACGASCEGAIEADGGCSCRAVARPSRSGPLGLVVAAAGLGLRRLRRRAPVARPA